MASVMTPARDPGPPPVPPVRPDPDDCCNSGCHPCIFDLYEEALDQYRRDLERWQAQSVTRDIPT